MSDHQGSTGNFKPDMGRSDSSGTSSVDNVPTQPGPDGASMEEDEYLDEECQSPMSPRRSSDDIEALGREAQEEMRRHAQALQESLLNILNRIEAVKEEHDKLDSHNKFLQKYIGDLMSTSKITASGSRSKK